MVAMIIGLSGCSSKEINTTGGEMVDDVSGLADKVFKQRK